MKTAKGGKKAKKNPRPGPIYGRIVNGPAFSARRSHYSYRHAPFFSSSHLELIYLHYSFLKQKLFFKKLNYRKVNYFLIFDSVMKNKLKNNFQCLIMLWKIAY
jgi:hypothetical protein